MKSLTKLTLTALFAVSALMIGSAYAADQATEAGIMDCSRLPADATKEQLLTNEPLPSKTNEYILCLQSLHSERSVRQVELEQAFENGNRVGFSEGRRQGYQDGRNFESGYGRYNGGGYGGD
jgi:hypothetical protein